MSKKTLNIGALCVVVILIAFVYAGRNKVTGKQVGNIAVDGSGKVLGTVTDDNYQNDILEAIAKQQIDAFSKLTDSYKKLNTDTLSDKIAKDVFSQYIQYNTSGTLDQDAITEATAQNIQAQTIPHSNVKISSLKMVTGTVNNLKIYGNKVAKIQDTLARGIAYVSKQKNVDIYVQNLYMAASNLYMMLPVPQTLAQNQADIINAYRDYSTSFILLRLQQKDPAKALLGIDQAKTANNTLIAKLNEIQKILKLNKVVYEKTDPAYGWINPIEGSNIIKTE
jgi:hypothetical protein